MPKPPQLPPTTRGFVNAVPCPNCGKPNNLAGHHEMLDTGTVFGCDHCHQPMQVAAVQTTKLVHLRKPAGKVTRIKKD